MAISKIRHDFRMYFAAGYFIISAYILSLTCYFYPYIFDKTKSLEQMPFFYEASWSYAFTLLGFCLLVLKICINDISETAVQEIKKTQRRLWYWYYYPIMLIVMSLLACTISHTQFKLTKMSYFAASALLSFLFGFFIDSLPGVLEKLGSKLGAKS
jgi:magnesium-transporting ATPase (P-type)